MGVVDRIKAPTPKFFRVLGAIGLVAASVGGTLTAAPVALPAVVVKLAHYLIVGGGVLASASKLTVDDK